MSGEKKKRRKCKVCKKMLDVFATTVKRYCSSKCRDKARRLRAKEGIRTRYPVGSLLPCETGAIGEMLVCANLLIRKIQTFRAVSPGAPFDLVALIKGKLYRVEVTKGRYDSRDNLLYANHDKADYDILAIWFTDGDIIYLDTQNLRLSLDEEGGLECSNS